jgi:hypothetical protein
MLQAVLEAFSVPKNCIFAWARHFPLYFTLTEYSQVRPDKPNNAAGDSPERICLARSPTLKPSYST